MLNPTTPQQVRTYFYNAWQKYSSNQPLTDLEIITCECIKLHPEYHQLLSSQKCINQTFEIQNNPFLHLSMHLTIVEQINTNQPIGITNIYKTLANKYTNHDAIHIIINCFQQVLTKIKDEDIKQIEASYLSLLNEVTQS